MRSLSLLILLAITAFAGEAHAKLRVVATTASLGSIARAVGGADADVDVLAAPSEDPHFVEPKPNLILKLNQADLLLQNGLDLEVGWLPKLVLQARNAKLTPGSDRILDASSVVALMGVPTGKVDRAMGDVHPGGNPHFLVDPRRGAQLARALGDRLAKIDAPAADAYRARAKTLADELDALATSTATRAQSVAAEKRRVVAYHRSLTYLVDWLKLEEVATVEPVPGVPPDPGHVSIVLQTMRSKGAKVLLQEEFYPKGTSQTLAKLSGAELVVLKGGPRPDESYVQWVKQTAEGVLHALGV